MQLKYILDQFSGSCLFRAKNIIILGIGCMILVAQGYWFLSPSKMAEVTNYDNTDWELIKGLETREKCLNLLPGQKLEYSFKSSAEVSFNIRYHDQGGRPIYLKDEKGMLFSKGVLDPPNKNLLCLMWVNSGIEDIRLSYNTLFLSELEDKEKDRIPARFRVSADKQSIRIVAESGSELARLEIGSNILNFELNNNAALLAVSIADLRGTLLIYDAKTLQIITKVAIKRFPRFLAFSADNRFLIVGDEHTADIIRIDLKNRRQHSLILPLLPLAIMTGEEPGELFVRAEREVMKIKLEPLELIERNARIEFNFGEETILADPNEFCTAHGVPHPLFTPNEEAMSTEGLQGYYFESK